MGVKLNDSWTKQGLSSTNTNQFSSATTAHVIMISYLLI
jgi:hypothetical protein